jgi:hypothetical protein
MRNLRVLDLDFLTSHTKIRRPGTESSVFWKFLCDIESIQLNTSINMEELTLRAPAGVLRMELSSSFWKNVAEMLDGPGYRYFRNINVVVGRCEVGNLGQESVENWIKEQLFGCQARGTLRVTFDKP